MKQPAGCLRPFALVATCLCTGPAFAGEIGDAFSKFDRAIATFNPLGEHVRKPIERAVPRLTFRGALRQWSDVLIDTDDRVGFREQDFRFLQLQNLLELETFYNVAPGLDINAVTHAMYDGVYDWQHSGGLYADRLDRTNEVYDNAERILRELYVSYRTPGFDLMLGKQQVIWGKMDGQFIDIRVPRFMVLAIWPAVEVPQPAPAVDSNTGEPYRTPYMDLLDRAIAENRITARDQGKKELLADWFREQTVDGEPVSQNLADAMATLIRLPSSQRGGAKRGR